ncbi:hypothetical protein GCM10020331_043710 [Ectobacillus funiculus]
MYAKVYRRNFKNVGFFKRLRDLTMSNVYALIEKAEDPIKMTDQYLRDMQQDLEDAEKSVAAQIALEKKKFKVLYEEQEALVKKGVRNRHILLCRPVIWIWHAAL